MRQVITLGAHIMNQKWTTNDKKKNFFLEVLSTSKKKRKKKKEKKLKGIKEPKTFHHRTEHFQLATDKTAEPNRNTEVV